MNIRISDFVRSVAAIAVSVILSACNGGGTVTAGGGGGIVGTGKQIVASGEVTRFGSVFVNGIEFVKSTDPGTSPTPIFLAFEDLSSAQEESLRTGMVVTVTGSYDSTSRKGVYTRIVYSPEVRGPLDVGSVDVATGSFAILGRVVQVGVSTVFDGIADLNELSAQQGQGLELEVDGYLDAQGRTQASRIAIKSSGFGTGRVQVKGTVSSIGAGSFTMGSLTVSTAGATFSGLTAADLSRTGLVVEVRGTWSGTTVTNARIELKSATSGAQAGETVSLKGVAAGPISGGGFVLSGADGPITVTTAGALFERGNGLADAAIVSAGARLEVEGAIQPDGSIAAATVSAETERTVRIEGNLNSVDPVAGILSILGIPAGVSAATSYRDNRTQPPAQQNLTLAGLVPGDHVQLSGFLDANGSIIVSQLQRFDASTLSILQGPVAAVSPSTARLTILGVTVVPQSGATLSKGTVVYADFTAFSAQLLPGSSVVKAKGSLAGTIFTATSLEIQP